MLSSKKRKDRQKGQKISIWSLFELKEFLYYEFILATLWWNRVQYLKIFVIGKVCNFFLFVPPVIWVTKHLQTGYLKGRDHAWFFLLFTTMFFHSRRVKHWGGTKAIKIVEKWMKKNCHKDKYSKESLHFYSLLQR